MQTQAVLCSFEGGRIADRNCFGIIFYFITDTDAEKYYFRIISAMNSDKRVGVPRCETSVSNKWAMDFYAYKDETEVRHFC